MTGDIPSGQGGRTKALKSTLGFGMMRLAVKNGDPTDFDYEQLYDMVDTDPSLRSG
jgi:predicted aldo/keto reductase-like oxidoreductase